MKRMVFALSSGLGDASVPRLMPPAGEVGEALERVLESQTFARSGRARDLLRYLVEREQVGEADALKGYSIALDVFHRDPAFDPSTDSVVRVQARRLRDLLAEYYAREGSADPLRIEIPRGGYVPAYSEPSFDKPKPAGLTQNTGSADPETLVENQGVFEPAQSGGHKPGRRAIWSQPGNVLRHIHLFWVAMAAVI